MKKSTGKYVYLIALMLAFSVNTISAQQPQKTQTQTRQQLRDRSNTAFPQQQKQLCGQNKTRQKKTWARARKAARVIARARAGAVPAATGVE